MASDNHPWDASPSVPGLYRVLRWLVRIWFSLLGRKGRVLGEEGLPDFGPVLLVVKHPPSFSAALALVAASDRQVYCVVSLPLGFWGRTLAQGLRMISVATRDEDAREALASAREALSNGAAVALFPAFPAATPDSTGSLGNLAATFVLEEELSGFSRSDLEIFPVHMALSEGRGQGGDGLIFLGSPVAVRDFLAVGPVSDRGRSLASVLDEMLQNNAFSLMENELRSFLSDLEEVLKADLEEGWAARPDWKQKTEGFKLSEFLAECLEELNVTNPARLVALRDRLNAYREALRRWELSRAEVEAAQSWLEPMTTRLWYWFESIVGLPLAFYGFVNHFLAWAILRWRGLLKKEGEGDAVTQWLLRGLVVLGCYAAQIAACAYGLGRAAAGYYAISLPVAGLILLRYRWLVKVRTRLLIVEARLSRDNETARRLRKQLIADIDATRDAYAKSVGAIP